MGVFVCVCVCVRREGDGQKTDGDAYNGKNGT